MIEMMLWSSLQASLSRVEHGAVTPRTDVVVWHHVVVDLYLLGILEVDVGLPQVVDQPFDGQRDRLLLGLVGRKGQPVIVPRLGEENLRPVTLK